MTRRNFLSLLLCGLLLMTITVPGVYALWQYAEDTAAPANGSLSINPLGEPERVYILDTKVAVSSNVDGKPYVTEKTFLSYQHGDYSLKQQRNNSAGGSVSVEVTVKNHSGVQQYFMGHMITPALLGDCVVSYQNISVGTLLQNDEVKTFRITIHNTSGWSSYSLKNYESILNFSPNFDESFTENASLGIAEIFKNILAGKGVDGEGTGIVYKGQYFSADQIMQLLTSSMEQVDTGGYIGNVGNASQDQKDLITAIFGEHISMQLGGQYYSVSLLIKNQQIDGYGANDMVLYVTADQLTVGGGNWQNGAWRNLNNVPVYGLVFINNGTNDYIYCDHLFQGEAPVCNFGGDFGTGNVGNFNTNLWNSTEYPNLTDSSNGQITQDYITKDGELDDAYQYYMKNK